MNQPLTRTFVEATGFRKQLDELIGKKRILRDDFDALLLGLLENPNSGDLIPGLGGLRKIRIKSSQGGKRGGFRIDYLDLPNISVTHLLVLYPKNVKSDLSPQEKRLILNLVQNLKKGAKNV